MKALSRIAGVSTIALLMGGAAMAQSTLTGIRAVNDQIDDINYDVNRDLNRASDDSRFGNPDYKPGLSGSAALSYTGNSGNTESQEITIGGRLRYASGPLVQNLNLAIDFAEDDNSSTQEDTFAVYELNYYFNDQVYAFVLGRMLTDGLADEALTTAEIAQGKTMRDKVKQDGFLGFGPGYRIFNQPDLTWRVQAGIGVSYMKYGNDESDTETGYIASSRFFKAINENVFLTMDTDVLKSSEALRVNNDLGVNFKVAGSLSTRISYLTDYNETRRIRTDNKLGVSLVYGF
jgi:putative salt-induced outer membrane protein